MAERRPRSPRRTPLRVVGEPIAPDRPVLAAPEAKRRFVLYFLLKLAGLAAMFGGVFLARDGIDPVAIVLLAAGSASLFVRPRMLGLTVSPRAVADDKKPGT